MRRNFLIIKPTKISFLRIGMNYPIKFNEILSYNDSDVVGNLNFKGQTIITAPIYTEESKKLLSSVLPNTDRDFLGAISKDLGRTFSTRNGFSFLLNVNPNKVGTLATLFNSIILIELERVIKEREQTEKSVCKNKGIPYKPSEILVAYKNLYNSIKK